MSERTGRYIACQDCHAQVWAEDQHVTQRSAAESEARRLREALEKIRRIPAMPFPDPDGHSWRAFAQRVYNAWGDVQVIARAALAAQPGEKK